MCVLLLLSLDLRPYAGERFLSMIIWQHHQASLDHEEVRKRYLESKTISLPLAMGYRRHCQYCSRYQRHEVSHCRSNPSFLRSASRALV